MDETKKPDPKKLDPKKLDPKKIHKKIKMHLSGILRALVVATLVMAQFALIVLVSFALRNYSLYFYVLLELLSIILIITLVNESISPSYKIAWICVVLLLPITGHLMFLLWGKSGSKKKIEAKVLTKINHGREYLEYIPEVEEAFEQQHPSMTRLSRYLEAEHFPITRNNQVAYYEMGEDAFEAIFLDMEQAEHFVLVNFFIVGEGVLWDRMHEILLRKIKQGVEVKFLYDDFGAMFRTEKNFKRKLEAEGFEVRVFNPIHKYIDKLYMNYRSHQKIVVVDGKVGYTGGINIADEYANIITRFGVWKDTAVRVSGDAVWGLAVTFLQMWEASGDAVLMDYAPYRAKGQFPPSDVYCHVVSDGPANNPNNPIETMYRKMIIYAQKYVYIMTPYLVLENDMRDALIVAAKSGVDVRIIVPNIPDKKYVKLLTNYHCGKLLENGIRIYEYTPGFIHAKVILNEECGVVGTINMDYRSFYLHYECGVWMSDEKTLQPVMDDFGKTMAESHEMDYEEWKNRPFKMRLVQPILNLFATLL